MNVRPPGTTEQIKTIFPASRSSSLRLTALRPSTWLSSMYYAIEEVSSADSVSAYEEAFSRARDGALEPPDTAAFLRQLAEQLE